MEDNQKRDKENSNNVGQTSINILEEQKSEKKSKTKAELKREISGNIEELVKNTSIIENKYNNELLKIKMRAFS